MNANFKKCIFLNDITSISTGSMCIFTGERTKNVHKTFIEFADCHKKIRLQRYQLESVEVYINKIEQLKVCLSDYVVHLKQNIEPCNYFYNKRLWLNSSELPGTDSIVVFDGYSEDFRPKRRCFFEISDSLNKVRFHLVNNDTLDDYILKCIKIISMLNEFINYLKKS